MPPLFMSFQRFSLGQSVQNGGHARVYRPRRDLNRAIGLMLNSTPASYTQLDYARAINRRLSSCSRIGFHEARARARACPRRRADFRENGHAIGSFRATSSIPSVVSRSSSYGDSALMLDSYSEDRENFIFTRSRNWEMKNVKENLQERRINAGQFQFDNQGK